jgi:MATE family multidrug resistance protein
VGLITPISNVVATQQASVPSAHAPIARIARDGFVIATFSGLVCWGILLGIGPLLTALGQPAQIVLMTSDFLVGLAPGMLPLLWFQVLRNVSIGLKRPGPLVKITLLSVAANAILNYVLMFGVAGWQGMGLVGIGYATTSVQLLATMLFFLAMRRDRHLCPYLMAMPSRRSFYAAILRLGVPTGAAFASEAGFFSAIALLIGTLGTQALAAHTIVNQAVYIVLMVSIGLSHASSITISECHARPSHADTRQMGMAAIGLGTLFMAGMGLLYLLFPQAVLAVFIRADTAFDAQVLALARDLLYIAIMLQFFDCLQNIGIGALRGLDRAKDSLGFSLIGYWLVGLPCAWLLGRPGVLGIQGVWIGLAVGLLTTACLLWGRFFQATRR